MNNLESSTHTNRLSSNYLPSTPLLSAIPSGNGLTGNNQSSNIASNGASIPNSPSLPPATNGHAHNDGNENRGQHAGGLPIKKERSTEM